MKAIGPVNALYPMPTTLVGATVNGKPNFLAVAHVGIMNHAGQGVPRRRRHGVASGESRGQQVLRDGDAPGEARRQIRRDGGGRLHGAAGALSGYSLERSKP